jgi:hypothetical protein
MINIERLSWWVAEQSWRACKWDESVAKQLVAVAGQIGTAR